MFPDNAKAAIVVPLDKKKPDKNDTSNFRSVSLLNTFYVRAIKDQLVLSIENYLSPMVSEYIITHLIEERRECLHENFVLGSVLTNLPKAFDCIAHDILIAKLAAYGFSGTALHYVYSNLSNRKQCVRINNTHSNHQKIISGVPQGSILEPIYFNLSINLTISELIDILQSESEIVIDWFKNNKVIVNPDKSQVILLDKRKSDYINQHIVVDNQNIKVVSSAELLEIRIDNKLNFNLHIRNICRSAANQLNALIRIKRFLCFEEKKILINSSFMENFNTIQMFSSASSLKKIENLQKRSLRFLRNDYEISYEEL